jgi:polyisoprenyl-teichoic acid--peptidoglycan teichoic acid transferase
MACKDGAMDKLTHAGRYGTQCTIDTVESLLGITINYSVKINFPGFMNLIDVIGDITVDNQYAFTTYKRKVSTSRKEQITLDPYNSPRSLCVNAKRCPAVISNAFATSTKWSKAFCNNLVSVNSVVGYADILEDH